jgi:TolA-binding protein
MPKGVDQVSELEQADERATDAKMRRHGEALRAERDGCPHPELLFTRQSEALDADVRDRLAAHVSTCAACRRLVEDVDGLGLSEPDAAIEQRVLARVTGPARKGSAGLLSLAAGLLLASGLGVTWWYSRTSAPAEGPPTASQVPGVAQAPAPTAVALWTIAPAPVRVPLSSLGATRSGEGQTSDGLALVAALAPYQSGDYEAATVRLLQVVKDAPASGEAHFYLGVSQLMAGRPEAAVASLAEASRLLPVARQPEAEWYRATAEQRVGLSEPARTRLRTLCAQAGAYQAQGCAAEASLK